MTFREMFKITLPQREKQLSNAKHLMQWTSTMEAYVFPTIGTAPVGDVTTAQVLKVLSPIWFSKPETVRASSWAWQCRRCLFEKYTAGHRS